MSRWGQALAVIAGAAAGAVLLYGTYLTVEPLVARAGGAGAPGASSSPTPTASPTATGAADGCVWELLADEDRPAVLADEPEGLPEARAMTDATWDCVGAGWDVEVRSAGGDTWRPGGTAQALYLVAPDGVLLKLFDLRTDVAVEVLETDLDARLAWTARRGEESKYQVVQVELDSGLVIDDWGGSGIPDPQRDRAGAVWNVAPLGPLEDGGTLWGGTTARGALQSLFVREDDAAFAGLAAQKPLDNLVADGAVNARGRSGLETWVSEDRTLAVFLAQRLDASVDEPRSTGVGTWIVADLVTDQWRVATAHLPDVLCAPAPGTYAPGDYGDPGELQAVCATGSDEQVYVLSVDGEPGRVDPGAP